MHDRSEAQVVGGEGGEVGLVPMPTEVRTALSDACTGWVMGWCGLAAGGGD